MPRPTHEYLGFSAGTDFESRIMVKIDAPKLLEAELSSRKWRPQVIAISGVTDPYQPIERKLGNHTRMFAECWRASGIRQESSPRIRLVTRDSDLLSELGGFSCAAVIRVGYITRRRIAARAGAANVAAEALVWKRSLNCVKRAFAGRRNGGACYSRADRSRMPGILSACAKAGAQFAGYTIMRLPFAVAPLFERWLDEHFPSEKRKFSRVFARFVASDRSSDPRWGTRIKGRRNSSRNKSRHYFK